MARSIDNVPAGHVYVDGHRTWDDTSKVLDERRRLASDGVVTLSVTIDKETGEYLNHPLVKSSGFLDVNGADGILEQASEIVLDALEEFNGSERRNGKIEPKIKRALSKYLYDETRMRPTIIVQTELV